MQLSAVPYAVLWNWRSDAEDAHRRVLRVQATTAPRALTEARKQLADQCPNAGHEMLVWDILRTQAATTEEAA